MRDDQATRTETGERYQNGVDLFEEKDYIGLGELDLHITIEDIDGFEVSVGIIKQGDVHTK